jgi:membrane-associated phospholipid phosphatase
LILLFFRFPSHYRLWRNTLAFTTGLALIGFYFFPLLPPRLLPPQYHFVDTLRTIGGLWNFSSGAVNDVSNQYASMPSLHTAWSAWCALVVISMVKPWWGKLALLYPAVTIFCIVVTANHYFSDAIAGLALLGVSYLLGLLVTRVLDDRSARRELVVASARAVRAGDTVGADPSARR